MQKPRGFSGLSCHIFKHISVNLYCIISRRRTIKTKSPRHGWASVEILTSIVKNRTIRCRHWKKGCSDYHSAKFAQVYRIKLQSCYSGEFDCSVILYDWRFIQLTDDSRSQGPGKRGHIVTDTSLPMMFLGLRKTGKHCGRGQTGKLLCRQQCVLIC